MEINAHVSDTGLRETNTAHSLAPIRLFRQRPPPPRGFLWRV